MLALLKINLITKIFIFPLSERYSVPDSEPGPYVSQKHWPEVTKLLYVQMSSLCKISTKLWRR